MRVELLFWAGCPSHPRALADLREALSKLGLDPDGVVVREVESEATATAERFVGSPTIRIDGVDVQPPGEEPFGLTCRVYRRRDGRVSPTPDRADLRDALRAASAASSPGAFPPGASLPGASLPGASPSPTSSQIPDTVTDIERKEPR